MKERRYLYLGITLVLSACAILVFYNTFFQTGVLLTFFKKLLDALFPVICGLVMAYLLNPIVCFFEKIVDSRAQSARQSVVRGLSIFCTWCSVGLLLYFFFRLLLPQLYASIEMLVANAGAYYEVVRGWLNRLMSDNPEIAALAAEYFSSYYENLVTTVTEEWLPQIEVALLAVTGGLVSMVSFLFDLLVGVCVSVYLLARKETFLESTRRLLYSFTSTVRYERTMGACRTANAIFSGYVRGQLLDALIIGGLCLLFCTLFSMPYAPLVSMIVGVTNLIPFFGPFLGAIPSAFLILLVDPIKCLYFVIFILVLQQCDGNIIKPKLLGQRTGLSGFWIIFSILVGGGFFGPIGMLLGVPVFACIHTAVFAVSDRSLKKKAAAEAAADKTPADMAEN